MISVNSSVFIFFKHSDITTVFFQNICVRRIMSVEREKKKSEKFTVIQYDSKVLFLFSNFILGLWQLPCKISPQIDCMCHFLFKNTTLWMYIQGQIFYLYPVGQWAVFWGPLMSCWFSCPQCVSCSCLVVVLDVWGFFFNSEETRTDFFCCIMFFFPFDSTDFV